MKSILTLLTAVVLFGFALTSTSCKKCSKDEPINGGDDTGNTPSLDTTTSSSTIDDNSKAPGDPTPSGDSATDDNSKAPGDPTPSGDSATGSDDKKGGGSGTTERSKDNPTDRGGNTDGNNKTTDGSTPSSSSSSSPSPSPSSTPKSVAAMKNVIKTLDDISYRFGVIEEIVGKIRGECNVYGTPGLNQKELEKNWPDIDVQSAKSEAGDMSRYIVIHFYIYIYNSCDPKRLLNEAEANKNKGKDEVVSWANEKKANIDGQQIKNWIAESKIWAAGKRAKFPFENSFYGVADRKWGGVIHLSWSRGFELLGNNLNKLDGLMDELSKNLDDLVCAWDK
jgi:hypothetical protein